MSENKWARFLHTWGAKDLGTATSLVNAHVFADLDSEERALLQVLRKYHDVLLLKQDDSLQMYQTRLRSLYKLGILNLSLPACSSPEEGSSMSNLLRKQRSLVARLREANKRHTRAVRTAEYHRTKCSEVTTELDNKARLLRQAKTRLKELQSRPDYVEPNPLELDEDLDEQAAKVFECVDADLDLEQQMKYDPSGFLTTFWEEQRKILRTEKKVGRRWNPQVLFIR